MNAPLDDDATIARAIAILDERLRVRKPKSTIGGPNDMKRYLRLHYRDHGHEEFNVLFLNSYGGLIANETMSRGTLDQATVYPREIAKMALKHNAAAIVLAHNHPEGASTPSAPDRAMTERMQHAMALIGVHVLDHMVVGVNEVHSFAEHRQMNKGRVERDLETLLGL